MGNQRAPSSDDERAYIDACRRAWSACEEECDAAWRAYRFAWVAAQSRRDAAFKKAFETFFGKPSIADG